MKAIFRFVLGVLVVLSLTAPAHAQWSNYVAVTVTNPSGIATTNMQVQINLTSTFDFSKTASNGSDIRITASDGETLIPFWIQTWNPSGQTATIWAKVPSVPTAGTTIYLYYGNPNPPTPVGPTIQVPPNYAAWTRSTSNPIVPAGDSGNGANLLAEDIVQDPSTGLYWMAFSNYRNESIGLASSSNPGNAASWTWNSQNPVVPNAIAPHLIQSGGTWYLFYGDRSTSSPYSIRVSTASNVAGPYSYPGAVVLSPTQSWESYRDDEPFVFQRADGVWVLIYMGDSGNNTEQVGFATASNIAGPYTKSTANPVLKFGPDDYDSGTVADPWVYTFTDNTTSPPTITYYIAYSAANGNYSPWRMAYATTTDWVNFTKQGMMLPLNSSGWDSTNSFRGAVSLVGNNYVISYTGDDYEMGVATQPAFVTQPSIINNPQTVFNFYDNFPNSALDTSKWLTATVGTGSFTVASNTLTLKANGSGENYIRAWANRTPAEGTVWEVNGQHLDEGVSNASFAAGFDSTNWTNNIALNDTNPPTFSASSNASSSSTSGSLAISADKNVHTFQVYRTTTGKAEFGVDGTIYNTLGTSGVPSISLLPWLFSFSESPATESRFVVNWVRLRNSPGTDATTQVGTEETVSGSSGPLALASLGLSPNPVFNGTAATATVTLTAAAPTGGALVLLTSSNSAVASVPANVTVPAGSTSATFPVSTPAGSAGNSATISAYYNAGSQTAVLTISSSSPSFSVGLTPSSQAVTPGNSITFTATSTASGGFSGSVKFTVSGLPTGASGSFSPTTVSGSGSSTLTVTTSTTTPTGAYTVTVTGTSGSLTSSATTTLLVSNFSIAPSPSSQTVAQGGSTSYTATTTSIDGFNSVVSLKVTGLPTGAAGTFSPTSISGAGSSTLTVTTNATTTPVGSYTLTITGTSGSLTQSTTVTLVVNASPNFSLSASPSTNSVAQGSPTSYTATIGALNGFGGVVTLGMTGLPTGASAGFSPATVTGSGTSTISVTTSSTTPVGTYTLTITGTSGSLSHSTTVSLSVTGVAGLTVSSLTLNPTSTIGGVAGTTSTGTVTLSGNAPAGGAVVTLSSANTSVATVPASVTVAANTNTATFTITPLAVGASTPVSITATLGVSQNATLTVIPPSVVSLTFSPSSVQGGNSTTGTITLNGPAAGTTAQLTAALSSPASSSTLPEVFTAGSTTLTFSLSTPTISSTTPLTVTATAANGSSASTTLTITAP